MATISVIIVNYNAGDRLSRCLAALERQTQPPIEVILVDNGSHDGSFEEAVEAFPWVIGLPMGRNLGFAAGNNRAARQARGEWLALLNPDAYAERHWLEELVHAVGRWPNAKAFGSTQLAIDPPGKLDGAGDNLHVLGVPYRGHFHWPTSSLPPEGQVLAPCAAAALYDRATFLKLGGFDERFFCYCEDVDLGARLHHAGHQVIQVPLAKVRHEGSGISGRMSEFTVYHGHRNRLWLVAKAFPSILFWVLLPFQLLVDAVFILKFAPTPLGKAYRKGISDGLRATLLYRRERRDQRSLSSLEFLKLVVWSPLALMRRRGKSW